MTSKLGWLYNQWEASPSDILWQERKPALAELEKAIGDYDNHIYHVLNRYGHDKAWRVQVWGTKSLYLPMFDVLGLPLIVTIMP